MSGSRIRLEKKGVCFKLQRTYNGPFKVIERGSDVLYQIQPIKGGTTVIVHYNRLKPCVSQFLSERLEGGDESKQPPLQKLADQPTLQRVPLGVSKRLHRTEEQPSSVGEKGAFHQHGLMPPVQQSESSLELAAESLNDGGHTMKDVMAPSIEMSQPVRQKMLPAWAKDYHFDSRTSPSELEGE